MLSPYRKRNSEMEDNIFSRHLKRLPAVFQNILYKLKNYILIWKNVRSV